MTYIPPEDRISQAHGAVARVLPPKLRDYMTPRMFKMLIIVIPVLLLIFAWVILGPLVMFLLSGASFTPPPATVSTTHARLTDWQPQLRAIGTLHAIQGADLSSEVVGLVTRIGFRPGDDVRKGMLLVQLRDDSDRATLAALRASAVLAAQTYQRDVALNKVSAISKQDYDTALASMENARAQADAQAALVEKKAIRAPYDGRIGINQVDVGQYVSAGQVLVTLQELDPILVDFEIPQQQMSDLKVGGRISLTTDAVAEKTFVGQVLAFDPKVDPATRNVHVRAAVRNPDKVLLPGMFATVEVDVHEPVRRITLPQTAVVFSPYGDTVFVVVHAKDAKGKDGLVVRQRFVVTGEQRGDQVAITSGVKPDEDIVSSGQIKLKNGAPVVINNSVPLPNESAPTPQEDHY
ncbi:MAG TPA: efflux RND transporter periplasmic adaptor subunit [Rhizomicrobium sp.]